MSLKPTCDCGGETAAAADTTAAASISRHADDLARVATGTGINLIGSVSRTVLYFLYSVFLAAFLDPAGVGLFFLGFTILQVLSIGATLGLDTGVVRYVSMFDGEGDHARVRGIITGAIALAVPVSILVALLLFVLANPIAEGVFGKPALGQVLRVFSAAVPLFVLARLCNAGTQGLRLMKYQVYSRDMGEQFVRFSLSMVLLVGGLSLLEVTWANVAALAVATVMSAYFLFRVEPLIGRHLKKTFENRRLYNYSLPLAFSALIAFLLLWVDTLFLGYFRSAAEVGTYSIAMRIAVVGSLILFSFNTMLAPFISDLYNQGEMEHLQALLRSVTKWVAGLSFPFFSGLALFPEQVLRIMGSHYTEGATILVILALGKLFDSAVGPVSLTLLMCGRPRVVLVNSVIVFLADVGLCIFLIPRFGAIGAALAASATIILFNLVALGWVWLLLGLKPFSASYGMMAVAGGTTSGLALVTKELLPLPLNLLLGFIVFVICYLSLVYFLSYEDSDIAAMRILYARAANIMQKQTNQQQNSSKI